MAFNCSAVTIQAFSSTWCGRTPPTSSLNIHQQTRLNICKYFLTVVYCTSSKPSANKPPRIGASELIDGWQVFEELFGNPIRLRSFRLVSLCAYWSSTTLLYTRGSEFPQQSVSSEWVRGFLIRPDEAASSVAAVWTSPRPDVALRPHVAHYHLARPALVCRVYLVWGQAELCVNSSGLCETQADWLHCRLTLKRLDQCKQTSIVLKVRITPGNDRLSFWLLIPFQITFHGLEMTQIQAGLQIQQSVWGPYSLRFTVWHFDFIFVWKSALLRHNMSWAEQCEP